ncbi:MAG TPA: O-antigen ligase family protein [Bryobacteraceae bacterium]|nr:O-antigen ligase family protein [Bryobacteraceae bacterium]
MGSPEPVLLRAARWLTLGSAVSVLFSIAACQILLALALAALLFSGAKLRLPPIWLPLGLFLLATLISLALSDNPTLGLPQVRKFYVFLELLVVFSTLRDVVLIRRLFLCWAAVGAVLALRGFVQFAAKVREAHALGQSFYDFYVPARITGFMSHWMTYSGQEMFILLMLAAFLFFAPGTGRLAWLWGACGVLVGVALVLGFTRSIWLATAGAGLYLLWGWRRAVALATPALLLAGILVSPGWVKERFRSILRPSKVDSNAFRVVTTRTGLEMIRAHPWFGLGPEEVKYQFDRYVPPDIPRPLPDGWYGHLHNIYLHYAAERGIPAMLILLWLLGRILFDFLRGLKGLPPGPSDARFVLAGGVAVVLAVLLEGFFELNLGDSEVLTMFLVVVGCGYLALETARGRREERAVV